MTKQKEYQAILKYIQDKIYWAENPYSGIKDITKITEYASYEQYIQDTKKIKKSKPQVSKEVEESFQAFWTLFPATSKFTYKDRTFQGERSLKSNKSVCMKLYNEIIQTNAGSQWDISQTLLKALQVQLEHIKIESYRKNENRMAFMSGMEPYLRQKKYEPWVGEEMPESTINTSEPVDTTNMF